MNDKDAKRAVIKCLNELYASREDDGDDELFEDGVRCERCLVFRFAYRLQNYLKSIGETNDYFVDCDYDAMSDEEGRRHPSKKLKHDDGRKHLSYVDVIVHKRKLEVNPERNGWICIEFKKRDNEDEKEWNKDEAKLADLTSRFDYQIGFFVILAEYRDEVEWKIFKNGRGLEFQAVPNEI